MHTKLLVLFTLLIGAGLFFVSAQHASAACTVDTFWRDERGRDFRVPSGPVLKDRDYTGVAKYSGCQGMGLAQVNFFDPSGNKLQGPNVEIKNAVQDVTHKTTLNKTGSWYFQASGLGLVVDSPPIYVEQGQCKVQLYWLNNERPPKAYQVVPYNPVVGESYKLEAKYEECQGAGGTVRVVGTDGAEISKQSFTVGGSEYYLVKTQTVAFAKAGTYKAYASNSYASFLPPVEATVTVKAAASSPPAGSAGTASPPGAGTGAPGTSGAAAGTSAGATAPGTSGTAGSVSQITNLLPFGDILELFLYIMRLMLGLVGLLATVMVIWGGIQMVVSQGNSEATTKAKKTIYYALIGLAVALLSFSIIAAAQNLLQVR